MTNPLLQYADAKRWVNWKLETSKDGKPTKVPYQPNDYKASTTDPATWRTLAEVHPHRNGFNGPGIVFTPDRLLLGVDGDHILAGDRITDDCFSRFVTACDTYTEVSQSGTGLHMFLALAEPLDLTAHKHKFDDGRAYEAYAAGRYFTVTFKPFADKPIRHVTPDEALKLLGILGYPWPKKPLTDDELLEKMFSSLYGATARALYNGETDAYGKDDSAADQAFVNRLAWWTNRDPARMERLWLRSTLGARDKVKDRKDYRDRTIAAALDYVKGGYTGDGAQKPGADVDMDRAPGDKPLVEGQLQQTTTAPVDEPDTDTANAARFAVQHGATLRYVMQWGWMIYDSNRWKRDDAGAVVKLAKQTARSIAAEAADQALSDKQAEALLRWAKTSKSLARLEAMIKLAQPELPAVTGDFDKDPYLFNCANGTIDLRTITIRPHAAADMLTRISPARYTTGNDLARWRKFNDRVQASDDTMIQFLQRAAGYAMTGDTDEHCFFFLYGTGRNGKSTFTETIQATLGDYAGRVRSETLLQKRGDNAIPNDLASMTGTRMIIASELPQGRQLDEPLIKDLTGGDTIRARFLRQEFFDFNPQAKIWLFGNHKPNVRGTDEGIWSRVKLIPFEVTIPPEERDKKLKANLIAHDMSAILEWMVEGCRAWQADGLRTPAKVDKATEDYRSEMDILAQFIKDSCEIDKAKKVSSTRLYEAYKEYAGSDAANKVDFGKRLKERGFTSDRGSKGVRMWKGISLGDEMETPPGGIL